MENKKTRLISEFFKFGFTGGLGTITNLLIFFLLVDKAGFPAIPVSILCFIAAGTQNYFLNHLWSFREYTAGTGVSAIKWLTFLAGSLAGLSVNILVMNAVLNNFNLPFKFIGQACGIAGGMAVNFVVSKLVIFRKKIKPEQNASPGENYVEECK